MREHSALKTLPDLLLPWYERHARSLPWRADPTPYKVLVSELMLQQTRVEAALPYFERFVAALPDFEALANAPEAQLMKLWQGLGYYSRARNLQRAAQLVVQRHGGRLGRWPPSPLACRPLRWTATCCASSPACFVWRRTSPRPPSKKRWRAWSRA